MIKAPVVDLYFSFRSAYSYIALAPLRRMPEAGAIDWNIKVVYPLATRLPDFFSGSLVHDVEPLFGQDRIPVLLWRLRRCGLLALANT